MEPPERLENRDPPETPDMRATRGMVSTDEQEPPDIEATLEHQEPQETEESVERLVSLEWEE